MYFTPKSNQWIEIGDFSLELFLTLWTSDLLLKNVFIAMETPDNCKVHLLFRNTERGFKVTSMFCHKMKTGPSHSTRLCRLRQHPFYHFDNTLITVIHITIFELPLPINSCVFKWISCFPRMQLHLQDALNMLTQRQMIIYTYTRSVSVNDYHCYHFIQF